MNKKTKALTTEQYKNIIQTMKEGTCGCRPNERIATALVLEGNLGLRISDILKLKLSDIVKDGDRYRLCITEQKTGKQREFTVPLVIQQYIDAFCAAERPPVRLPAATQRCQRPGLIDHFMFNHNIIMLCHSLKQRVG